MSVIASRADVVTDAPARYAKQLVSHLGRKLDFTTVGATSTAVVGAGSGQVVVGEGVLRLLAHGPDVAALKVVEHVLGGHLERFGRKDELHITWVRTVV